MATITDVNEIEEAEIVDSKDRLWVRDQTGKYIEMTKIGLGLGEDVAKIVDDILTLSAKEPAQVMFCVNALIAIKTMESNLANAKSELTNEKLGPEAVAKLKAVVTNLESKLLKINSTFVGVKAAKKWDKFKGLRSFRGVCEVIFMIANMAHKPVVYKMTGTAPTIASDANVLKGFGIDL